MWVRLLQRKQEDKGVSFNKAEQEEIIRKENEDKAGNKTEIRQKQGDIFM